MAKLYHFTGVLSGIGIFMAFELGMAWIDGGVGLHPMVAGAAAIGLIWLQIELLRTHPERD